MREVALNCLRDCSALCCQSRTLAFDFTEKEAKFMRDSGAELTQVQGMGYYMERDCPFLKGKKCVLHNTRMQPQCCSDNRVGEKLCLLIRGRVFRRNEVE